MNTKLKILVVDDDEPSELLVSITLENFSREILKARTGIEAVEICKRNPDLDLIIMDIKMPVMDGYEATAQIRRFNKNVVIIAHSAYALNGESSKANNAGCNDYISKPLNKRLLNDLLQKYF